MADNPLRVAAAATNGIVTGTLLEAMIKRFGYTLDVGEDLIDQMWDVGEPHLLVHSVATGLTYFLDTDDSTTEPDGLTCLVTGNGLRYHLEEGAAIKLSAVEDIVDAPAGGEPNDMAYVVSAAPSGEFAGHATDAAIKTRRGWVFAAPEVGLTLLNKATGRNVQFSAAGAWGGFPVSIDAGYVEPRELAFPMGLSVEAQQNTPPGSPGAGDYYLVGTTPTGDWAGQANKIAYWTSTSVWAFLAAYDGATIVNKSAASALQWFDATGEWRAPWPIESVCHARISVVSATPVPTTDQTTKATLYLTRWRGKTISLYANGAWASRTIPIGVDEPSLSLVGHTASRLYDIFCYDNAGVPALESLIWTDDTTRATGVELLDGVWVKTGDPTRRLMGTAYMTATGQTEDSLARRMVANVHNARPRPMRKQAATQFWSYSSSTLRQADGNTGNQIEAVVSVSEEMVAAEVLVTGFGTGNANIGIGINSTAAVATGVTRAGIHGGSSVMHAKWGGYPGVGRIKIIWLEWVESGSMTFQGNQNGTVSAITGTVWA